MQTVSLSLRRAIGGAMKLARKLGQAAARHEDMWETAQAAGKLPRTQSCALSNGET